MHSVAVWFSLSAWWCISRSAIQGDTLLGHTAILGQGMDTDGIGGRLRQKVGVFRDFVLTLLNIFMAGNDREGKSYGGSHRGNQGVVPPAVGLERGHQGFGVVEGIQTSRICIY